MKIGRNAIQIHSTIFIHCPFIIWTCRSYRSSRWEVCWRGILNNDGSPPSNQRDIQHELTTLRQTVDAWNQDDHQEEHEEDHQQDNQLGESHDLPVKEGHDLFEQDPPGLARSASMAGSATTIIVASLELC